MVGKEKERRTSEATARILKSTANGDAQQREKVNE